LCALVLVALALIPAEAGKKNAADAIAADIKGFDFKVLYPSNIWAKMHEIPVVGVVCYKIDEVVSFLYGTFIRPMRSFNESATLISNFAGLLLCVVGCLSALNIMFLIINAVKDYFDNYIKAPEKIPFTKYDFPFRKSIGKTVQWFKDLKLLFFVPLNGSESGDLTVENITKQLVTSMVLSLSMYMCSFMIQELTQTATEVSMDNLYKLGAMGVVCAILVYFQRGG